MKSNNAQNLEILNIDDKVEKSYRERPYNLEAERSVLGIFLNSNESVNKVSDFLLPECFYLPIHEKIYRAILKIMDMGSIANPVTLHNFFKRDDTFEKAGVNSIDYLSKLSSDAAVVTNVVDYARVIYDSHLRRSLISIAQGVSENAYANDIEKPAEFQIEVAEQQLFELASQGDMGRGSVDLSTTLKGTLDKINSSMKKGDKINGVTTGYTDLDKKLGGMQESDLLIIAARPSMGKTSLAINIALNAAENFLSKKNESKPKSVGVFSLEMSAEQVATRFLSIKTGISGGKIRIGDISKDDFLELSKESSRLNEMPILIDDTPALTISALRTRARRMKRQHNLGILVIDYLQLLRGVKSLDNGRVQEIGEISQGLKAIAKELDIPVIALSQLSRAVESRDDKRPQLSDLRESGNIEQDADVVMFIYREEYYISRKKPAEGSDKMLQWQSDMEAVKNIAEIIIAKQRNGPIGNVSLMFDNNTTGFKNLQI